MRWIVKIERRRKRYSADEKLIVGWIEDVSRSLMSLSGQIYIGIYCKHEQVSPIDLLRYMVQFTTRRIRGSWSELRGMQITCLEIIIAWKQHDLVGFSKFDFTTTWGSIKRPTLDAHTAICFCFPFSTPFHEFRTHPVLFNYTCTTDRS